MLIAQWVREPMIGEPKVLPETLDRAGALLGESDIRDTQSFLMALSMR
jgi:hypothetical protein